MEVGTIIHFSGEVQTAKIIQLFSDQSSIIEGEEGKIHFIKLVDNEDIRNGAIYVYDWSKLF